MRSSDLPAIYQSADSGSNKAQKRYLNTVRSEYSLLALLALLAEWRDNNSIFMPVIGIVLILLFGLLIYRFVSRLDRKWYGCRALAESVKTSSWKFSMRAHPFEGEARSHVAVRNFLSSINEIRAANEFIGIELDSDFSDKDQISEKMFDIRDMDFENRLEFYIKNRVKEQRSWYARKAGWNGRRRVFWFRFAIFAYVLAAVSIFSNSIFHYELSQFFSFLIVVVTSSFAWIQVKRHGELAASYTLTAHEIGTIQGRSGEINSDEELSDFVTAAEFAFSREHTQWAARRDFS